MDEDAPEVIEPCDEFACGAPAEVSITVQNIQIARLCKLCAARLAQRYELYRLAGV